MKPGEDASRAYRHRSDGTVLLKAAAGPSPLVPRDPPGGRVMEDEDPRDPPGGTVL